MERFRISLREDVAMTILWSCGLAFTAEATGLVAVTELLLITVNLTNTKFHSSRLFQVESYRIRFSM